MSNTPATPASFFSSQANADALAQALAPTEFVGRRANVGGHDTHFTPVSEGTKVLWIAKAFPGSECGHCDYHVDGQCALVNFSAAKAEWCGMYMDANPFGYYDEASGERYV